MPDAGSDLDLVLRITAIGLVLVCYGSFTWAVVALFRRTGPTPLAMRWVGILGTAFTLFQLAALVVGKPPVGLAISGIALYAGSLALFWWAVPYARAAKLALAFTESQSNLVLQEGPYRCVRHPFYASYLLFWMAGVAAAGEPWLLTSVVVMGGFYLNAIRREERELLGRVDLPGYVEYRARTGCLMPWLR